MTIILAMSILIILSRNFQSTYPRVSLGDDRYARWRGSCDDAANGASRRGGHRGWRHGGGDDRFAVVRRPPRPLTPSDGVIELVGERSITFAAPSVVASSGDTISSRVCHRLVCLERYDEEGALLVPSPVRTSAVNPARDDADDTPPPPRSFHAIVRVVLHPLLLLLQQQ
eukprot:CAMPEP_0181116854 /NCGR_PEP_ID=MMETSP1071-20121207/22175_1 /TAXON_ID=35127 /ORGANISM="Thalassiosira sp., Strain NH16" /LENGTH=169 /DNA_ID=CAMNT_0023201131 /DNA_START=13 /DNA_END=520 /DNA_ORIENTATION=-